MGPGGRAWSSPCLAPSGTFPPLAWLGKATPEESSTVLRGQAGAQVSAREVPSLSLSETVVTSFSECWVHTGSCPACVACVDVCVG